MSVTAPGGRDEEYSHYKEPTLNDRGLPIRPTDRTNLSYIYLLTYDVLYFLSVANRPGGIHVNRLKDPSFKTVKMLQDGGLLKMRGNTYITTAIGTKILMMFKYKGLNESISTYVKDEVKDPEFYARFVKVDKEGKKKYVDGFTLSEAILSLLAMSESNGVRKEYTSRNGANYGLYSLIKDIVSDVTDIHIVPDVMGDILSLMRGIRKRDVRKVVPCVKRLSELGYSIVEIQNMFHIDDSESIKVLMGAYNTIFSYSK